MKKLFFTAVVVSVVLLGGYIAYHAQNKVKLAGMLYANIEALANNTEEGTKAEKCYIEPAYSPTSGWVIFCDSKTSSEYIFPCLEIRFGYYNDKCIDRCTQK